MAHKINRVIRAARPLFIEPPQTHVRIPTIDIDRMGVTCGRFDSRRRRLALIDSGLSSARTEIPSDCHGRFVARAAINGKTFGALIDTGATEVCLQRLRANAAGIQLQPHDFDSPVYTANGVISCAIVTLDRIQIGGIVLRNVSAAIGDFSTSEECVVGMSFLSRISRCEIRGGRMLLEQ